MGTRVEGTFCKTDRAEAVTAALLAWPAIASRRDVRAYVASTRIGSSASTWFEISDKRNRSLYLDREAARAVSEALKTRTLWLKYNDTTGADEYALFESGLERASGETIANGLEMFGADDRVRWADDVFDAVYTESAYAQTHILVRDGRPLERPELWAQPPEAPYQAPLLNREFAWGKSIRTAIKALAYTLAGGVALLMLWVLVILLVETLR